MKIVKRSKLTAAACALIFLLSSFAGSAVASEDFVLKLDFESGQTDGWKSEADAGAVVQEDGGQAFQVGSGDMRPDTEALVNYTAAFRVKIDFKDSSYPGIYLRSSEAGSYRIYFDAAAETIELEKRQGTLSVPLGRGAAPLQENSGHWTDMELRIKNNEIVVSFAGEEILRLQDALPLAQGGIGFSNGGTVFLLDDLTVAELPGAVDEPGGGTADGPKQEEIPGEIIYACDFEDGKAGWSSMDNKSQVVTDGDTKVYHVQSYDHEEQTLGWTDFSAEFDIRIEYGAAGSTWPALYLKWAPNGARYDVYFDSAGGSINVEHVQGGQKRWIGSGDVSFLGNDGKWVHMKAVYRGGNIRIYYEDMSVPVVDVTDETPIIEGGIGFGDGGAQVYVDNIEVRELPMEVKLPDFNAGAEKTDYAGSAYAKEIRRLIGLAILQGDEEGNIHPFDDLSRAEFAQLLFRAQNLQPLPGTAFADVPESHWASGVIGAVSAAGLMNGYVDGLYRPDELVTADEALKSLVCLLGYGVMAEYEGGYPQGYRAIAARKGLNTGVSLSGDETITREAAAKLLSNALDADILFAQTYSGTEVVYGQEAGRTVLSEYHRIFKGKGLVTDTDAGSLSGVPDLPKGMVRIDGSNYLEGSSGAAQYLGSRIDFYYQKREQGEPVILWAEPRECERPLKISAGDLIKNGGLETLRYFDASGRVKEAALSKNLKILVNGGTAAYAEENLCPEIGSVTLIKTGESSQYDLAMVERWDTLMVGAISRENGQIRDYYRNQTLELDIGNPENTYTIVRDGEEAGIEELSIRDVLLVARTARPGGADYRILASSAKLQGSVDAFNAAEAGRWTVETRKSSYQTSPYYQTLLDEKLVKEALLGETAMFYFDAMGNVAVMEPKGDSHIALLNAVALTSGISAGWKAEVLGADNQWNILEFPDTIKFNGAVYSVKENGMPDAFYQDGAFVKQLVYLKRNQKGRILSIDTAQPAGTDAPLTDGHQYMNGISYSASNGSFDNRSYIDGSTLVFAIPAEDWDRKQYTAAKQAYFQGEKSYTVKCYNENEFEVAGAVLVYEGKTGASTEKLARPFMVDEVVKVWDSEEIAYQLCGYQGGSYKTELLSEECAAGELERGDVVLLKRDFKGKIAGVTYLLDRSKGVQYSNNPNASLSTDRVIVEGDVIKYNAGEGRLLLCIGQDSAGQPVNKAYAVNGEPAVYLYDKANDRILAGSLSDIAPGIHVMMEFCWDALRDMILYPEV